jgi:ribosomal protein L12E/L44/L45/RPP1/RPP2
MMFHWGEYEGRPAGNWRLDTFLGERDRRAFFVGQSEVSTQTALVEIVEQNNDALEALRASWERASKLNHPNVMRVFETGDADFDGEQVAYAVMDLPDDDVGEILEKHTLDAAEARNMAAGAAEALAYLHEHRLCHGAVRPSNMFLVRGRIALSPDTIAPALEADKRRDMRELGVSVVQAITGAPDARAVDDPATKQQLAEFGSPFRQIAEGCLHGQWTPADVLNALAGRPAPPRTLPPAPAANRAPRRWPLVLAAAIGVVALLTYATRSGSREAVAAKAPKKIAIVEKPAPEIVAQPQDKPRPIPEKALPKAPAPVARVERPPVNDHSSQSDRTAPKSEAPGTFAVIAATYNTFSDAARRAEEMHKKFPALTPHVFPPKDEGKMYYVVLGSGLSQEAAERLRREARRLGAPRDTYVTKLSES